MVCSFESDSTRPDPVIQGKNRREALWPDHSSIIFEWTEYDDNQERKICTVTSHFVGHHCTALTSPKFGEQDEQGHGSKEVGEKEASENPRGETCC
jgi:hypothetical protein